MLLKGVTGRGGMILSFLSADIPKSSEPVLHLLHFRVILLFKYSSFFFHVHKDKLKLSCFLVSHWDFEGESEMCCKPTPELSSLWDGFHCKVYK